MGSEKKNMEHPGIVGRKKRGQSLSTEKPCRTAQGKEGKTLMEGELGLFPGRGALSEGGKI